MLATHRTVLKCSELVVDSKMDGTLHLYFPKREGGLNTPIDIIVPLAHAEDKGALSTLLYSFIERIHALGMRFSTFCSLCPVTLILTTFSTRVV